MRYAAYAVKFRKVMWFLCFPFGILSYDKYIKLQISVVGYQPALLDKWGQARDDSPGKIVKIKMGYHKLH